MKFLDKNHKGIETTEKIKSFDVSQFWAKNHGFVCFERLGFIKLIMILKIQY